MRRRVRRPRAAAAVFVIAGMSVSACAAPGGTATPGASPVVNAAPVAAQVPGPVQAPVQGAGAVPGLPLGAAPAAQGGGGALPAIAPGTQGQPVQPVQPGAGAVADVGATARGPAPTRASIEAVTGAFPVMTTVVAAGAVQGFGGGTIYYPTGTNTTFGAVAIAPGFTAKQSSMAWLGPRLASQGFVVMTIDTLTVRDQPASRGTQLLTSLTYLTTASAVRAMIDPNRLAVMGHSMGGGGALAAARTMPGLRAAIPLTPWNQDTNWAQVTVPTLVIGAQNDNIAPVDQHAKPFFAALPQTTSKEYVELAGASHFAPTMPNATIAAQSISWLKRFVDGDTRYSQFICPAPAVGAAVSAATSSCPF